MRRERRKVCQPCQGWWTVNKDNEKKVKEEEERRKKKFIGLKKRKQIRKDEKKNGSHTHACVPLPLKPQIVCLRGAVMRELVVLASFQPSIRDLRLKTTKSPALMGSV